MIILACVGMLLHMCKIPMWELTPLLEVMGSVGGGLVSVSVPQLVVYHLSPTLPSLSSSGW